MIRLLLLLILSTTSIAEDDYTEGLRAGQPPLGRDFNQILQDNLGDNLNQRVDINNTDSTRFTGQTANNIISAGKETGTNVAHKLKAEGSSIIAEGAAIDLKSQERFTTTDSAKLSAQDLLQHSVINQETFSNHENPATQYLLDIESSRVTPELVLPKYLSQTDKQEYTEILVPKTEEIVSYKYCSETLIDKNQSEILDLNVAVVATQPPDVEKIVTAHASSNMTSATTVSFNLMRGGVSLVRSGGWPLSGANITNPIGRQAIVGGLVLHDARASSGCAEVRGMTHQIVAKPSAANNYTAQVTFHASHPVGYRNGGRFFGMSYLATTTYSWKYKVRVPVAYKVGHEKWINNNPALQDLKNTVECKLLREECLEGSKTKIINGLEVMRPCWKKKLYYECAVPQGENNCDNIPSYCIEEKIKYIEFFGAKAVKVKKFRCVDQVKTFERQQIARPAGLKDATEYQKNNDLGDALTALNFANEIKNEFARENKGENGLFFKGDNYICNFTKGCCVGKKSGWSKVFHCSKEEKKLAERVPTKACYKVGTFRETKGLLQKIKKVEKIGYCCFASHISRIIQQGAHSQLNKSWGDPKNADCRALTLAELEQLDFSLPDFDFSDLIADLKAKASRTSISNNKISAITKQVKSGLGQNMNTAVQSGIETASIKKQQENIVAQNEALQDKIQAKRLEGFNK